MRPRGLDTVAPLCWFAGPPSSADRRSPALLATVILGAARTPFGKLGGGLESMSNAPYLLPKGRFGYRMGDGTLIDSMTYDGLTCTFDGKLMAVQNSDVSAELGIGREAQDRWALRSHERAVAATDAGRF